jgi:hypothetical protein
MFERFTAAARMAVVQAQEHARRLGHGYIGCEHLLLAAACTGEPASAALREHGITPQASRPRSSALALLAMHEGAVPPILSALGASQATLRAAILDRYRQAS